MIRLLLDGKPSEHRCCADCRYMEGAVNWWCRNQEAIEARGTAIPGVHSCNYWSPAKNLRELPWWQRFLAKLDFLGTIISKPCDGTHGGQFPLPTIDSDDVTSKTTVPDEE